MLRDRPKRREMPYIYHLDVGAMYPNIILTNRLQPSAIVDDATCAACDYNQSKNKCKRQMEWVWRGDYNPATRQEYDRAKDQLSRETVDGEHFLTLPENKQAELVANRLKTYSRNAYKKTKVTEELTRHDTVCMRENDFYVDTVRRFRDRRYELKKLTKVWKKKISGSSDAAEKKAAEDRTLIYDSLQVAHKCILNSFYGYVMRKGARWRSMEMAGIVTKTGADLITQARVLVEQIGRPLELDTDGIWCILPKSFPDVYNFKTSDGGSLKLEYPCVMLNADVHDNFTNHQYQTLTDAERGVYESRTENSIFFEVDGPYRCMVLPSSTEEGKLLKKRYAVFNFDGSLAELKGFELKRRGELELIKTFQSQVFERFLDGESLEQCYDSVAEVANYWIDILDTQGESLETDELVDLISENRNMSRQLEDYGDQKGTSQTTARRLGEFLGAEIIKDKGLNCKFIIAEQPYGAPVTERAIPTAIWKAEPAVMKHYLKKWLKAPGLDDDDFDIRNILDWGYYSDRLGKTIQKIITIPAALQKVDNPVPRIPHPGWLNSKVRELNDSFQQVSINSFFKSIPKEQKNSASIGDIEDFGRTPLTTPNPIVRQAKRRGRIETPEEVNRGDTDNSTDEVGDGTAPRVTLSKESFGDWLKQRKTHWQAGRRKRKRMELVSGSSTGDSNAMIKTGKARRPVTSMEGYMRDAANNLRQNDWHVIEIREMSTEDGNRLKSSGTFILWAMIGTDTLQKVQLTVPRVIYVSSSLELVQQSNNEIQVKQVDRHLPHNKNAAFLYEVTLTEYFYKSNKWMKLLRPLEKNIEEPILETIYETSHPLMLRALTELGCVVKIGQSHGDVMNRKSLQLHELQRVDKPAGGEYLHKGMNHQKIFFYHGVNQRSKTGIIAVFTLERMDKKTQSEDSDDDREMEWEESPRDGDDDKRMVLVSSASIWVVKPGFKAGGQRGITKKQCESLFENLLETIHALAVEAEAKGEKSDYGLLSPSSLCKVKNLNFTDDEGKACAAASDLLKSSSSGNVGPSFLVLNCCKSTRQLRQSVPGMNSFPVITLPFPPGIAHNPSTMNLPALNWEQPAIQLLMEAYLYMVAVSYPKRIQFSRYGQVPIGNLGQDEFSTIYDVSLSRQLVKSRALSWANPTPNSPDLGMPVCGMAESGDTATEMTLLSENDIWGNETDVIKPIIRRPGSYRSVCIEIEVHDLAIAALTIMIDNGNPTPSSPASVTMFGQDSSGFQKSNVPLGDEMSTNISLPLLRIVVGYWLRDAFTSNCQVADDMLHHLYRLVSSPGPLLCDPALHRSIHSMMKTTFMRLLGELQRLGCTIVYGSFHRITISTNKATLSEAEEYINFVIATISNRSFENGSGGIEKVALRPTRYYSQVLFYDEYNFGGIELERRNINEIEDMENAIIENLDESEPSQAVYPSVLSGWSMSNYLGSEIAQEYFRIIIARFSKDIFRKEYQLRDQNKTTRIQDDVIKYKRKVISKHFASDLSRALDEIIKEGGDAENFPAIPGSHLKLTSPALEFVKSVSMILELDADVQKEVQSLKRSLLAQLGVAEYSKVAEWKNPCASFILPDLFCIECHESRDLNLCELPPMESSSDSSVPKRHWACEDCGTPYDPEDIEQRLVDIVRKRVIRYQLQDVRCSKTNRISTRALAKHSCTSAPLKLDNPKEDATQELQLLHHLAQHHELEFLEEITEGLLTTYAEN